jgi:sortase A
LKKGVAHARGSVFPGEEGNTYIFAHSTDAFYNVGVYNAVFYLLGKLKPGDEIDVFYKGKLYIYKVYEVKVVEASELKYLGKQKEKSTLTLQTCYPPGTTLKRLIVLAELEKTQ